MLQPAFWAVVLAGAIRLATPIAYAALGETLVERSGMLNLGIEGMMLVGALAGIAGSHYVGPWARVLAGGRKKVVRQLEAENPGLKFDVVAPTRSSSASPSRSSV